MVSFDVAQDREPVERPFHDLWIDGGETEKRPPYPQRVIEPAKKRWKVFLRHDTSKGGPVSDSFILLPHSSFSCVQISAEEEELRY
jgi:hypothetical protein